MLLENQNAEQLTCTFCIKRKRKGVGGGGVSKVWVLFLLFFSSSFLHRNDIQARGTQIYLSQTISRSTDNFPSLPTGVWSTSKHHICLSRPICDRQAVHFKGIKSQGTPASHVTGNFHLPAPAEPLASALSFDSWSLLSAALWHQWEQNGS